MNRAILLMLLSLAVQTISLTAKQASFLGFQVGKAPAKALSWKNPYSGLEEASRAGDKLFEQHCAECHGKAGLGTEQAPSLKTSKIQSANPGALFWFVRNGKLRAGMPSWSRLPNPRIWQIVTYLQEHQK